MCLELFFLFNQLADFVIIAAVARVLGLFRFRRVYAASTLGAVYAVLARGAPWLSLPVIQFTLLMPVSMLIAGRASPRTSISIGTTLAIVALSTGVCAARAGQAIPLLFILPWLMATGLGPTIVRPSAISPVIEVIHHGAAARLLACVDTGNRLTEPLSGQPVMIVNAKALGSVLPDHGYRRVAYSAISGSGCLDCFRPDRIYILKNGRRRRAPDAWIAVFPDRLPLAAQALAPAAYAFC